MPGFFPGLLPGPVPRRDGPPFLPGPPCPSPIAALPRAGPSSSFGEAGTICRCAPRTDVSATPVRGRVRRSSTSSAGAAPRPSAAACPRPPVRTAVASRPAFRAAQPPDDGQPDMPKAPRRGSHSCPSRFRCKNLSCIFAGLRGSHGRRPAGPLFMARRPCYVPRKFRPRALPALRREQPAGTVWPECA